MTYTNNIQILSNYKPNNHSTEFTEILNNILSNKPHEIILELFHEHNHTNKMYTINSTISVSYTHLTLPTKRIV